MKDVDVAEVLGDRLVNEGVTQRVVHSYAGLRFES